MPAPFVSRPAGPHRLRPAAVTPGLPLYAAALAAALIGAAVAYFVNADEPPPVPAHLLPATLVQPTAVPPLRAPVAPVAATPAAPAPRAPWLKPATPQTPVLTLTELQELQQTLSTSADPTGEFTRLSEQVLLADATQRFLQLRAGGSTDEAELQGLVQLIEPALDAQLERGDVSHADAVELKSKLLQARYPQAAMQQAELARWLAAHPVR